MEVQDTTAPPVSAWYTPVDIDLQLRSDSLPSELLRGITPCNLLSFGGKVLRERPDSLSAEKQSSLFKLSTPVPALAFFISHCWNSPGWQKYLALMLYLLADWALVVGSVAALLVMYIQRFHCDLPIYPLKYDGVLDLTWHISLWELCIGMVVFWSMLIFGHTLFRWGSAQSAFLDCACIHQTDCEKKMTGITHTGSFLRASEVLVILWDPHYFQRGWCVYELASFLALRPHGRIVALPLKVPVAKLAINLAYFLGSATVIIWPLHFDFFFFVAIGIGAFVSGLLLMFAFDWYERDVIALQSQFDEFDFSKTKITVESDRQAIEKSIIEMYPNGGVAEFNSIVRTKVKKVMLKEFSKQRCRISYRDALILIFPSFCANLSCLSSYRHSPAPFQLVAVVFKVTFIFAVHPLVLALSMLFLQRGARTQQGSHMSRVPVYICGAATVSILFVVIVGLGFYLPGAVAMKRLPIPSWSKALQTILGDPWNGAVLSLFVSLFIWPVCVWFFWPRRL